MCNPSNGCCTFIEIDHSKMQIFFIISFLFAVLVEVELLQRRGLVKILSQVLVLVPPKDSPVVILMSVLGDQKTLEKNNVQNSIMSFLKENIMIGYLI